MPHRAAPILTAVVFAAGEGTRLRPLTADRPKPMVPVAGRPILDYILEWLAEQGVARVGINLHYRPEAIQEHVGDGARFGLSVRYSRESHLLGSAGALLPLRSFLDEGRHPFVAVYGDTLAALALWPLRELHLRSGAALTMAVMDHPNPTEAGIVEMLQPEPWHGGVAARVARIKEKPTAEEVFSTVANAGIFVMGPRVVDYIPKIGPSDIARDLIPTLIAAGEPVSAWKIPPDAVVWDVGTWANYRRAEKDWPSVWARRRRPEEG